MEFILLAICPLILVGLGIFAYIQYKKDIKKRISLLKLKKMAGNITPEELEWYRNEINKSANKLLANRKPKGIRINPKDLKVGSYLNDKCYGKSYFPKNSDFKSMAEAECGLNDDKDNSLTCLDEECKGKMDEEQLEKPFEERIPSERKHVIHQLNEWDLV